MQLERHRPLEASCSRFFQAFLCHFLAAERVFDRSLGLEGGHDFLAVFHLPIPGFMQPVFFTTPFTTPLVTFAMLPLEIFFAFAISSPKSKSPALGFNLTWGLS